MKEFHRQAAVLLALSDRPKGQEEILLTLRAVHLSSHSGEVAFPGGKWEPGDPDLYATALREAEEEVGLVPQVFSFLGELQPSYTRQGTRVTPYVGRIPADVDLAPNPSELDELFWFPLAELVADKRVRTDVFEWRGEEYWSPAYRYAGHIIWGFTARVLVEFLARFYGIELGREHSAPEIRFRPK
ncbi:NUDIX hydrolase [Teredinibacter turnerae]|uniref:Nudix hydroxylase n=1 Tax=Teredinibacter turnerae (strain ATCC 39867 / T7901) TaxID=377629 RepID=C5BR69_TERTT|nr:CoA pyrophosphatase [Teredinibacter turnerae]ACR10657.1 nudix hydroxylase [Teredinibacter turnerae T7901]